MSVNEQSFHARIIDRKEQFPRIVSSNYFDVLKKAFQHASYHRRPLTVLVSSYEDGEIVVCVDSNGSHKVLGAWEDMFETGEDGGVYTAF